MSPTSIGFVFLLGILHVCSGKTLGLTTYRLSAGWTSFGRKFYPMFEENLCSHVQFFFFFFLMRAFTEQTLQQLSTLFQKHLCPVKNVQEST